MHQELTRKITLEQLSRIDLPIGSATGLPNASYTDPEFFLFERDHVFSTSWAALAFAADFNTAKKVWPIDFMGYPLIVTCDKEGEIRVFHNVCSHRGRKLVSEEKPTNGMLVCPYHSWSYDFSGSLRATPHIGGVGEHQAEGFCKEKHGLKQVRSHVWMGILFVNLSGTAPAFENHASALVDRYRGFISEEDFDNICYAGSDSRMEFDLASNWKLCMENFMESYHLPWVHPSLNEYSPLEKHSNIVISESFAGQRSTSFNPDIAGCEGFPRFASWPDQQSGCGEYPAFYPNLMLGFQENHVFALIVKPESHDHTHEEVRLAYTSEEAAHGERFEPGRVSNRNSWEKVFMEDVSAVEGMQQGRSSPGYTGGAFSPAQDALTLHFHQWVGSKYREGYAALESG